MSQRTMKCIDCNSEIVETIRNEDSESYVCENGHENQRMIEHKGYKTTKEEDEVVHHSVGIIVKCNRQILLLKRRKYPTKFSIPAGHLEEGEDPDKAVLRELFEETGIESVESQTKILEKTLEDKCRRGADRHHWHLYITEFEEKPRLRSNDEAEFLEWSSEPLELDLTDVVRQILSKEIDQSKLSS